MDLPYLSVCTNSQQSETGNWKLDCASALLVSVLECYAQNWDRLRVPRHPDWSYTFLFGGPFKGQQFSDLLSVVDGKSLSSFNEAVESTSDFLDYR